MSMTVMVSAFAAAATAWIIVSLLGSSCLDTAVTPLEQRRRERLEGSSVIYRWFGGSVRSAADQLSKFPGDLHARTECHLARAGDDSGWRPGEWLSVKLFEAALCGALGTFGWRSLGGATGMSLCLGFLVGTAYLVFSLRSLRKKSTRRMQQLRKRLPFVIDSIGLSIECGAGIQESLAMAAESRDGNVVAAELAHVTSDVRRGQPLSAAMIALKGRLRDPLIDEFVAALNTGHQLGASVSDILLAMAKRMRERRAHEVEAAAGRAQIQLYYPGMLLMVVCIAVVVAPFVAPMARVLDGFGQ